MTEFTLTSMLKQSHAFFMDNKWIALKYLLLIILLSFIPIIGTFLGFGASLGMILEVYNKYTGVETEMGVSDYFSKGISYIIPYIVVSLVLGLLVTGGFFLLIVPGVILSLMFMFYQYAMVIDDKNWFESLNFSRDITSGRLMALFGYNIGFALVVLAGMIVAGGSVMILSLISAELGALIGIILYLVGLYYLFAISVAFNVILYKNFRDSVKK